MSGPVVLAILSAAILGQPVPEWPTKPPDRWVQGGPFTLSGLHGRVVLIRFFTDAACPYCKATAPALNEFHDDFGAKGLVVIGLYTPKPRPRAVAVDDVLRLVKDYGFDFPVAIDADWGALRRLWLDRQPAASFTSASLLVDRRGVVRYVHEGGVYAKDGAEPQARQDYEALRKTIVECLAEAP